MTHFMSMIQHDMLGMQQLSQKNTAHFSEYNQQPVDKIKSNPIIIIIFFFLYYYYYFFHSSFTHKYISLVVKWTATSVSYQLK